MIRHKDQPRKHTMNILFRRRDRQCAQRQLSIVLEPKKADESLDLFWKKRKDEVEQPKTECRACHDEFFYWAVRNGGKLWVVMVMVNGDVGCGGYVRRASLPAEEAWNGCGEGGVGGRGDFYNG